MTAAFSRSSSGVTKLRGSVQQTDFMEVIASAAMRGKRYDVYLIDDDPVVGNSLYMLVRSLSGELFISATYNA